MWLSARRDLTTARTFFTRALAAGAVPVEVITDRAPAYPRVLDELIPTALHDTEQYANNTIEADHGRLKPGFDRCVASRRSDQLASSPMVMPSSRTSDAATTRSPPTHQSTIKFELRSMN